MHQNNLLLVFALFLPGMVMAQKRFTISGTVRDQSSGEVLIGASVMLEGNARSGVVTNAYGFYSVSGGPGRVRLMVSFAGYGADTVSLDLERDTLMSVRLTPAGKQLEEVVVSAGRGADNVTKALTGVQKLSIADIRDVPVLFGEKDVLKTLQLLPGVQSGGDGGSGFYVRGGAADQNLILLDEATVYNPSHFLGFFSTFNSDAIKDVTLYKGAVPAEYGGRLSSVLDVRMNDGNDKDFHVGGGIGLIASRLEVEGPLGNGEKGSFMVSGRRTYADLFLKLSRDTSSSKSRLYFYDLNAKANYSLGSKDHLYLSGYFGKDVLGLGNTFGVDYGNTTATLRWNHVLSSRLFSNTSLIYSKYNYNADREAGTSQVETKTFIQDYHLKEDLQYNAGSGNKVNAGLEVIHHTTTPGSVSGDSTSSYNSVSAGNRHALESAVYVSDDLSIGKKLNVNYGLRGVLFQLQGPGIFYSYNEVGQAVDSAVFGSGQAVKRYFNLEPRLSLSYKVGGSSSIKASYTRMTQNLHLLSNTTSANPTDIWIPSSNNVQPEISDEVSLGYYHNFSRNRYEFSAEVYYRNMQNQIDYKNGAQLLANTNVESELVFGKGRAYGLELFLKKKTGQLTGWVSYTLSRTERRFDGVNNGNWYPASQDRTNNLSLAGIYKLSKNVTLSADFVYYTGNPVSWPSGKYEVSGNVVFSYTDRNGYRMPDYNRLDLGVTVQGKKTKNFDCSWNFSLYNAYGRENAYSISFQQDPSDPSRTQAVQYSLFRWVPSITYNFKF